MLILPRYAIVVVEVLPALVLVEGAAAAAAMVEVLVEVVPPEIVPPIELGEEVVVQSTL
jgi:hypothetical protein